MPPRLIIEVLGDTSNFERSMKRTGEVAGGLTGVVGRLSIGFGQLAKSTVIIYGLEKAFESLSGAVHAGIDEFKENASIQAQTNAALKSTGGIADVTSKQIRDLSVELSNLSGISDESIRSAENVELAFTNIRDSAGKGNDVFTEATKLIVDFSARTGKDAPAAALLFGKALEDPAKRVGILARAGVVLSESQVKVLKSTEKTQGILAAQKILIADLKVRFDGAAAAAGKTLPGALNILKERFKDLAGSGISRVAGPLRNAAVGLAAFVVQLTNAHGAVAKLDVLGDGLRSLAAKIEAGVKGEVAKINWDAVFAGVKKIGAALERGVVAGITALRSLGARLGSAVKRQIDAINWAAVVGRAGQLAGDAIVTGLNALTAAIRKVKWATVGKAIVDGIVIAIAATAKFLASVDWGKVVEALFRTLKAAIEASNSLMLGIGKEIGKLLFAGIQAGLSAAGNVLEKLAINIALKIIEPFTHIPGFLGGGAFQDIKTQLQATLADMQKTAATGGSAVGTALGAGITAGSHNAFANFRATVVAALTPLSNGGSDPTSDSASSGPAVPGLTPAAADIGQGTASRRKGITASQRNTFFDNRISRLLDQASSGGIQQQISKLKAIGALISARIAATKDVTRKLTLEQTLLDQVTRPLAQDRATVAQNFLDTLQLNVDKAQATSGLNDDLAALTSLQNGILARIKAIGKTNALEEQLVQVTGQIKQIQQQAQQNIIDVLNTNLSIAQVKSPPYGDDIKALEALRSEIEKQIAAAKGLDSALTSVSSTAAKSGDIVSKTFALYPGLQKFRNLFAFKKSGPSPMGYQSESYQRGDSDSFDPSKRAIELYGNKNKPKDVAGEIVSHFLARGTDPALTKLYNAFTKSITTDQMRWLRRDYKTEGDSRPFATYEKMSGFPALFRGSLFNQLWPDEVSYTDKQKKIFAQTEKLLKTQPAAFFKVGKDVGKATSDGLSSTLPDLKLQLAQINSELTQARNDARNSLQYKAIGLTATGDALVPGVKSLHAELKKVTEGISGTILDTSKTTSLLSHIRKVLSGGLGAVGRDVRDKIKGILDDISNQIKNAGGGDLTKFQHVTRNRLLAGLGLDTETLKLIKQRLASVGAGGTVPGGHSLAFAGGGVVYNGPVTQHFHGVNDPKKMQSALTKQARSRPLVRRGN